ncbi:unnamed protein product, partial [Ectocarpus sp. 6 AP-2014]
DNNTEGREKLRGRRWTSSTFSLKTPRPKKWEEWLRAPLEAAAARGDETLALELVGAGGSIGSAVHAAVSGGHVGLAGSLLRTGAPVDGRDSQGCTALHVAAAEIQLEEMDMLVQAGASLEAGGPAKCTPLDWAARHVNSASIIALMGHGAAVDGNADETENPLFRVVLSERPTAEALRPLLRHASDVDAHDVDDETVLHRFCFKAMVIPNAPEIVDLLLRWGACEENYMLRSHTLMFLMRTILWTRTTSSACATSCTTLRRTERGAAGAFLCYAGLSRTGCTKMSETTLQPRTPPSPARNRLKLTPEAALGLRYRQKAVPAATAARQGWKAAKAESVCWVATVPGLLA